MQLKIYCGNDNPRFSVLSRYFLSDLFLFLVVWLHGRRDRLRFSFGSIFKFPDPCIEFIIFCLRGLVLFVWFRQNRNFLVQGIYLQCEHSDNHEKRDHNRQQERSLSWTSYPGSENNFFPLILGSSSRSCSFGKSSIEVYFVSINHISFLIKEWHILGSCEFSYLNYCVLLTLIGQTNPMGL